MKTAIITLLVVGGLLIGSPWLTAADPTTAEPSLVMQPPSVAHLLGTDYLGRDVWARLLSGGQLTMLMTLSATLIGVGGGIVLGVLPVVAGQRSGAVAQWMIGYLLAFPPVIMALLLLIVLPLGVGSVALAAGISQMAGVAYVLQTATRQVMQTEYISAAIALGATRWQLAMRHVRAVIMPLLIAQASLTFGYALLTTSTLSFLQLGAAPGVPEWGAMLAEGRNAFRLAPWVALAPGLAIMIVVLAVQRLADHTTLRR